MKTSNKKYEITDIVHETYPFLHRVRALRDIGENVKAGDLGGFVEGEHNLETELSDSAWIFDDAIACGSAYVNQDSSLHNTAIACGSAYVNQDSSLHNTAIACDHAYVSCGSALYGQARAEDDAYLRGAVMCGNAYASGFAQIICGPDKFKPPILSGHCKVCGSVRGNVKVCGAGAVLPGEEILNDLKDITVLISDSGRRILRGTVKDTLRPRKEHAPQKEKSKKRGMER